MTIDTHQHFWRIADEDQGSRRRDEPEIARDYLPSDLRPELDRSGVDKTILVQSVNSSRENERMLEHATVPRNRVAGVVAWIPLARETEARAILDDLPPSSSVRGIRDLWGRADLGHMLDGDPIRVLRELSRRDLAWDTVPVDHGQREVVRQVARAIPQLRIVVDHMGRPPVPEAEWEPWAGDVRRLAALPNVWFKLSVGVDILNSWSRWSDAALAPYLQHLTEVAGADGVMWASNWPVVLRAASYERAHSTVHSALARATMSTAERAAVFGGTAIHCYRLDGGEPEVAAS